MFRNLWATRADDSQLSSVDIAVVEEPFATAVVATGVEMRARFAALVIAMVETGRSATGNAKPRFIPGSGGRSPKRMEKHGL